MVIWKIIIWENKHSYVLYFSGIEQPSLILFGWFQARRSHEDFCDTYEKGV